VRIRIELGGNGHRHPGTILVIVLVLVIQQAATYSIAAVAGSWTILVCRWLCLSVHLSVCLSQTLFLLVFVSPWYRAIFGHQFSMTKTTKLFSSIFHIGPLTPKIYSPKFASVGYWISHSLWVNNIWARRGDPVDYRRTKNIIIWGKCGNLIVNISGMKQLYRVVENGVANCNLLHLVWQTMWSTNGEKIGPTDIWADRSNLIGNEIWLSKKKFKMAAWWRFELSAFFCCNVVFKRHRFVGPCLTNCPVSPRLNGSPLKCNQLDNLYGR